MGIMEIGREGYYLDLTHNLEGYTFCKGRQPIHI